MKHIATFLLFFIVNVGFAQNEQLYQSFKHNLSQSENNVNFQTAILQPEWYLDSTYFYKYNESDWHLNSKIIIETRDDRGNDLEQIKYTIGEDSIWRYNSISNFTYFDNDVLNTSLRRNWDQVHWGDTVSFVLQNDKGKRLELFLNIQPNRRTISEYQNDELLLTETEYRRANASQSWSDYAKKSYVYNQEDLLIHYLSEDFVDGSYVNTEYDTIVYENMEKINLKRYTWSENNQWIPKYNVNYTNDNGNKITTIQTWSIADETWVNFSQKHINYDGDLLLGSEDFSWNGSDWIPTRRFSYIYNDQKWVIATLNEKWNATDEMYENYISVSYDRLEADKTAVQITKVWNKQDEAWKNATKAVLYWTEEDFHVDAESVSLDLYEIYPNPSHSIINIKGADSQLNSKIYSIDGKYVMKSHGNQIRISQLRNGIYILKTEDGFVAEFVKE